ncbi:hypothetical protein STENM223S_09501 [Streptomyces tendae]
MYAVSSRSRSTSGCSGPSVSEVSVSVRSASRVASSVRPSLTASLIRAVGSASSAGAVESPGAVSGASPSTASATASNPRAGVGLGSGSE